ncbi:unannotated protein [freshwater metagenome]|uniref:Unannotated protein n=1 Tax=freshwater metagenome TaxID=449393 RepID=A0A6J6P122_9ZZZZ
MAALVLLDAVARPPPVLGDVGGARVGHAVPARDPDPVGQVEAAGSLDTRLVELADAGAGAGVDARDVAELVQPRGPPREEGQGGLAAVGVGGVEALEVVPQRAALDDAERLGVDDGGLRLGAAHLDGGGVGAVLAGGRLDPHVVVVAREARLAGGLRAEGDGQQPPPGRELGADPVRSEVGLVAAGAGLAGDVDADRREGRVAPPGVHGRLVGRVALIEAVAGEVARGDRVGRLLGGARRGAAGRVGHGGLRQRERRRDQGAEDGDGGGSAEREQGRACHCQRAPDVQGRGGVASL